MEKTYFSKRVYKNELDEKLVCAIGDASVRFNRAKHYAFQTLVREKRSGKSKRDASMHVTLEKRFNLGTPMTNSALQEANALVSSQNELKKQYIADKERAVKRAKDKISSSKREKTIKEKMLASLIKGSFAAPKNARESKQGRFFAVSFSKETKLFWNVYDFEHLYLKPQIKALKQKISLISERVKHLEQEREKLKKSVPSVTFGSKKLFKAQFTIDAYKDDHLKWRKDFDFARYGSFRVSGRKDAAYGNFVFQYDPNSHVLHMKLPQGVFVIENVLFPHGQENIDAGISKQLGQKDKKKFGKPVAWEIKDHGDYIIIKCMLDVPAKENANFSKVDGVLAVDCNFDHFAWAEVNAIGQLTSKGTFWFDIAGKTSKQITKIVEAEAIAIVDLAVQKNKPIALEDLNTTDSKASLAYGNKKANRKITQFAYCKMIDAIVNRAAKMGVGIYFVNPAYTSQIGKIKYMKEKGLSIHVAAAYAIARRAMGFKEKLPPALFALLPEKIKGKHRWAHWSHASQKLKHVKTHSFFRTNKFSDGIAPPSWCELFSQGALTDFELKGFA